MYGKKRNLSNGVAGVRRECTFTCPIVCGEISLTLCKCKNTDYANRGSGYSGNLNSMVHGYRVPTFGE